jgi:hypothetical protein
MPVTASQELRFVIVVAYRDDYLVDLVIVNSSRGTFSCCAYVLFAA